MFPVQFPLTQSSAQVQFNYFETDSYFQQSSVKPQKKSRHWTSQEDELLLNGIKQFGHRWEKISSHYLTNDQGKVIRKAKSCSRRYINYWQQLYTIKTIQGITKPIRVVEMEYRQREIDSYPPSHLEKKSHTDSDLPVSTTPALVVDVENGKKHDEKITSPEDLNLKSFKVYHWTVEEDKRLLNAIQQLGNDWNRIVKENFLASKCSVQRQPTACYDRYRYYWQPYYSISEIQQMARPIEIKSCDGKRKIVQNIQNAAQNMNIATNHLAVAQLGSEALQAKTIGMTLAQIEDLLLNDNPQTYSHFEIFNISK